MKVELYNSLHSLIFYKKDSMLCALHYKRCLPKRPAQIYTGTGNKQVETPLSHSSEVRGPRTKHVVENFCCPCKLIKAFIGFIPVGILSDQRASSWEIQHEHAIFHRMLQKLGGCARVQKAGAPDNTIPENAEGKGDKWSIPRRAHELGVIHEPHRALQASHSLPI